MLAPGTRPRAQSTLARGVHMSDDWELALLKKIRVYTSNYPPATRAEPALRRVSQSLDRIAVRAIIGATRGFAYSNCRWLKIGVGPVERMARWNWAVYRVLILLQ